MRFVGDVDIGDHFEVIVDQRTVARVRSPIPEVFQMAMRDLGVWCRGLLGH